MVLTGNPARSMGRLDLDPAFDHVDTMPRCVRVRPAGTWGIFSPGLRRAEPFDGLTA